MSASEPARPASVGRNIGVTLAASAWTTFVGLLFVPIYIRFLGIEAYGLIGVYYALLALTSVVDFGITATVTRESAGARQDAAGAQRTRDLVRTLEIVYWSIGIVIAIAAVLLVPILAGRWINPVGLSEETLRETLLIIGIAIWAQWPQSFYTGALLGLQKHVLLGVVYAGLMTLRAAGAVALLVFVSNTIQAFFVWQVAISLLGTAIGSVLVWKSLPPGTRRPSFHWVRLRRVWRFAAGVGSIGVLGVILTQVDKILLTRLLPLDIFGYYALAGVAAAMLMRVAQPIYDGVFPRLTQLVANRPADVSAFYHLSCQLLSVAVIPSALMLSVFSVEVLTVWTGDGEIVRNTHLTMAVLVVGTALNALLLVPWALQLAHRWTRLGLLQNVAAVLILPVLIVYLAREYGPVGAATAWLLLNIFYVLIGQTIMHRRLLRGELLRWYVHDVARPAFGAACLIVPAHLLLPESLGRFATAVALAIIGIGAVAAAALASPSVRQRLFRLLGGAALPRRELPSNP